jgi:hypothetical protein
MSFISGVPSFDPNHVLDLGEFTLLDALDLHDILDPLERPGVDYGLCLDRPDAGERIELFFGSGVAVELKQQVIGRCGIALSIVGRPAHCGESGPFVRSRHG